MVILRKAMKAADKLDFRKKKKTGDGPDLSDANDLGDVNPDDKGQIEFLKALGYATLITEGCDAVDVPVPALIKMLETKLAAKYKAVMYSRGDVIEVF